MYSGIGGLMGKTIREVDVASLARVREAGFTGVGWSFGDPAEVSLRDVDQLRSVMEEGCVELAQVAAVHPDLVHPESGQRKSGIEAMQRMCLIARRAEARVLYVRPGSLNPNGPWYPHPENRNPYVMERLIDSLKELTMAAEQYAVLLSMEGHILSPLYSAERVKEVIEAVGSEALRFNADPVNFVGGVPEAYDTTGVVNHTFDVLGPITVSAHIKDFKCQDRLVLHLEETVLGDGLLDQVTFLRRMQEACPEGYVIIEHLADKEIPRAKMALDAAAEKAGVMWQQHPGGG
jgi:sugar phosphate isomerase/epimerase